VLGVLCLGCGALLARAAATTIRAPLMLPCGFAVVIVASSLATAHSATASFASPLVVGLAVAGLCFLPRRRPGRDTCISVAVGVTTFLLYGAPVLLSGDPTFAGYVKLDDTATFLAFADHVLDNGRDLSALGPSSYEATLAVYFASGYPLGAILPLGVGARLVGTDPAWVWQPMISFAAALLAMTLYALATQLVPSRSLRALVALVGAESALLYGYALWGGTKEVAAATLLALTAATLTHAVRGGPREVLVPATVFAAFIGVLSVGGVAWLVVPGVALLIAPGTRRLGRAVAFCGFTAVLTLPALAEAGAFLSDDNVSTLRSTEELGNLVRPLRLRQLLGVWPTGDFRIDPEHNGLTAGLVVVAFTGLALGVAFAWRRRSWPVLILASTAAVGVTVFFVAGSPWLAGKALAIASPVALFLAACGYATLLTGRRTRVALVLGGLLVAGVVWSNVLAYQGVWLAPYDQLKELEQIGNRFAGRGPALMTEYQPYGVRHFLRRLDAEGASDLRRRPVRLARGAVLPKGEYADLDEFDLSELSTSYRLLVLRRSPVASRPPAAYELVLRGRWYDVWQRTDDANPPLHLPLGGALDRLGTVDCLALERAAARVGSGGALVTPTPTVGVVGGIDGPLPRGWAQAGAGSGIVLPSSSGKVSISISVPAEGVYGVWVGGSFRGRLSVSLDGRSVGSSSPHVDRAGMWARVGDVPLAEGAHSVTVLLERDLLHPGSSNGVFYLGPVALAQEPDGALQRHDPSSPQSLCGTRLDWVEAQLP